MTDAVHKHGAKVFCQMYHAGRESNNMVNGGVPIKSSSPNACPWNREMPEEITIEEIKQLVKDFGNTAKNAKAAGMQAAIAAGKRGHQLTLWENKHKLGGELLTALCPPGKGEFASYVIAMQKDIALMNNVEVVLNKEAKPAWIDYKEFQAGSILHFFNPIQLTIQFQ